MIVHRPEPAFCAPETSLRYGYADGRGLLAHFEMRLKQQPDNLLCHTQRITLASLLDDRDAIYGALVDLFIVLAERGVGLKSEQLSRTVLQLARPQRLFLAAHLASGLRAEAPLNPPARRSVLTHGLLGNARPAL